MLLDKMSNIVACNDEKIDYMDQNLSILSTEEISRLKDAHAYIAILLAGADGKIDANELSWAEKIAHIRSFAGDERLKTFHEEVDHELSQKIKQLLAELPAETPARNQTISVELAHLNPILARLEPSIAFYLYKGYCSFAHRIATSSGGILSFFTISADEKKWVNLPMLTPISYNPEEEASAEDN